MSNSRYDSVARYQRYVLTPLPLLIVGEKKKVFVCIFALDCQSGPSPVQQKEEYGEVLGREVSNGVVWHSRLVGWLVVYSLLLLLPMRWACRLSADLMHSHTHAIMHANSYDEAARLYVLVVCNFLFCHFLWLRFSKRKN